MERVSVQPDWAGPIGETEARLLIARTLVIDSAWEAGLSVAQPLGAGMDRLVVYGRRGQADPTWGARPVQVRVVETPVGAKGILAGAMPDGLQAAVDWGEEEGLYLLSFDELLEWAEQGRGAGIPARYRATGPRWRRFVAGTNLADQHEN